MRTRGLFIGILVAAVGALAALARLREVERSGFEWTPGLITVLVLFLAITGRRGAWAVAFVFAGVNTLLGWVAAISDLEPSRLAVAAVGTIGALALWGLRPEDDPAAGHGDGRKA